MHAFLIVGNNHETRIREIEKRLKELQISQWDTIRLPDQSNVGIGDIRDFQRAMNLTPQNSPAKSGVLTDIDRLTTEAQNALLKTLEEPPPKTYILAETEHPELLLPTILSRFSLVNLGATISKAIDEKITTEFIDTLLNSSPGKKIQLIDPFLATHDDAEIFVTSLLTVAQKELLHHPSKKLIALIKNLLTARSQLSVNINPKLVVDNAILMI